MERHIRLDTKVDDFFGRKTKLGLDGLQDLGKESVETSRANFGSDRQGVAARLVFVFAPRSYTASM